MALEQILMQEVGDLRREYSSAVFSYGTGWQIAANSTGRNRRSSAFGATWIERGRLGLSQQQRQAVKWPPRAVLILTGSLEVSGHSPLEPLWRYSGRRWVKQSSLASPTGRAAQRLSEMTRQPKRTSPAGV